MARLVEPVRIGEMRILQSQPLSFDVHQLGKALDRAAHVLGDRHRRVVGAGHQHRSDEILK